MIVNYIKLGTGGEWEKECIREGQKGGSIRLGYRETNHQDCLNDDWDKVFEQLRKVSKTKGAATTHLNQVRQFYEASERDVWITFHAHKLWWCRASKKITRLNDNSKIRKVIGTWSCKTLRGETLFSSQIAGHIAAVQGYQGTICQIDDQEYIKYKIEGYDRPVLVLAKAARAKLGAALTGLIRELRPNDFELLLDLIFRQSGLQRVGIVGGQLKNVDIDLHEPITRQRIAVQAKSRTSQNELHEYLIQFSQMHEYSKFVYAYHTPQRKLNVDPKSAIADKVELWDCDDVADKVISHGLVDWLLSRAA